MVDDQHLEIPKRARDLEASSGCWAPSSPARPVDTRGPDKGADHPEDVSERGLQLIIASIPAIAWTARPDGDGEFFNQHYLDYVGLPQEAMAGGQWKAVIHPDDLSIVASAWAAFSAARTGGEVEVRLRRQDGAYRWFSLRSNPLKDAEGRVVRWYGVNIDIDDQKRAVALLEGERELLELIASGRPLHEVLAALCSFVERALPSLRCELRVVDALGATFEYGVAPSLPAALVVCPPGTRLDGGASPPGLAAENRCQVASEDIRCDPRWMGTPFRALAMELGVRSVWSWPISPRGGPLVGVLSLFGSESGPPGADHLDVVARAEHIASIAISRLRAEEELRRRAFLLETSERISGTGSFAWDLNGDNIVFSQQMRRLHDLDDDAELVRVDMFAHFHPDDHPMIHEEIARLYRGEDSPEVEKRMLTPDGGIRHVATAFRLFQYEDGRRECVGVMQDITRRRMAEDGLNRLRSELAHVTRVMSLGELAASITHEVNQPLAGVVTNASVGLRMLAADSPDLEGAISALRRTQRDGQRASEVIQRLKSLFRRQEFVAESVDLNDAAQEVVAICAHDLRRRRIRLGVELDPGLRPVLGDRIQLQQVILNFILNAADAVDAGSQVAREILLRTCLDGDAAARLSVIDTGPGIAQADRQKVFDAFFTTKAHGTGIGLSVSRSILERHGGSIWVADEPRPGATFCFSVPCAPDEERVR